MSKIVILSTQLEAPQIVNDLLDRVVVQNPGMSEWIKQLDTLPIITECVQNALVRTAQVAGVRPAANIFDYYGKAHNGALLGALETDRLPNGLGVKVNGQGEVEFVVDDYTSEWKSEIERLRKLFTDAFLAEVSLAILQILGYDAQIQAATSSPGEVCYNLEGVKQ